MSHWLDDPPSTHDVVTVQAIWVAIVLSILIHAAVLLLWIPRTRLFGPGDQNQDQASDRLEVELAQQEKAAPPPPEAKKELEAVPPRRLTRPRPSIEAQRPPLTAPSTQAPEIVAPPPVPVPPAQPPQPRPPAEGDFLSYLQGRRPATGVPESTAADEQKAEFDRKIAANLPPVTQGTALRESNQGGGIFEIKRMNYDDAAFEFLGWNEDMGRQTPQLIEVRLGKNSNMRIAVVRRMIVIIRDRKKGDFVWESGRPRKSYVLSARPEDNTALERFLMKDLFDEDLPPQ